MSKKIATATVNSTMTALRQLGNGKGTSRVEYARLMLPQRVEDNQLLSAGDNIICTWEGEDQELYPVELVLNQKQCTDAWLNKLFASVNALLGSASEQAKVEGSDNDSPPDSNCVEGGGEEDESVEVPNPIIKKIEKAIQKGNGKKLKKLLDNHGDELSKKLRKHYKKIEKDIA